MHIVVLLLLLINGVHSKSKISTSDTYRMKVSSTGLDSSLPSFFFMAKGEEGGSLFGGDFTYTGGRGTKSLFLSLFLFIQASLTFVSITAGTPNPFEVPVNNCPDDLFDNTMPDLRVPQLPWNLQDDWGCERETKDVPVISIESSSLKASVTTQWGGKVWSLYDKRFDRELLFANPAHQPGDFFFTF